jgi:hypothetical protein
MCIENVDVVLMQGEERLWYKQDVNKLGLHQRWAILTLRPFSLR